MENVRETLTGWAEDAKKNAGMITVLGVVTAIAGILSLVMPWAGGVGFAAFAGFSMISIGSAARKLVTEAA